MDDLSKASEIINLIAPEHLHLQNKEANEIHKEIKQAASEAIMSAGGTITHHHAVGRVHRQWYDRQRPDLFAQSLKQIKQTLDPNGILNPGILIDP